MSQTQNFTQGKILAPLLKFTLPVLLALCLQAMYGAVDLLVVGRFGAAADVSAVSTGSQIMQTITFLVNSLAMGATILLAQKIGQGRKAEAGGVIGSAICLFAALAAAMLVVMELAAGALAVLMQAPAEAYAGTVTYVRVCSGGLPFIVAYNVLGGVFRGMGDSKTPLFTVSVACAVNIAGDLIFVAGFGMGVAGAALATVLAQAVSVALCLLVTKRRGLPFPFSRRDIRFDRANISRMLRLGAPIALQELLVSISFLVILAIVNSLGVIASAGVGVAEKLCAFIMMVPSAYMQSLSAFVGQNIGAGQPGRAKRAMLYGMAAAFAFSVVMAALAFFKGDALAGIFARDPQVVAAAWDYLRAYAIDTLMVSFLFCFCGYFNGSGETAFVMVQGIVGAFLVRIPVSYFMGTLRPVSLFRVGLATPASTLVQILLCVGYFIWVERRTRGQRGR